MFSKKFSLAFILLLVISLFFFVILNRKGSVENKKINDISVSGISAEKFVRQFSVQNSGNNSSFSQQEAANIQLQENYRITSSFVNKLRRKSTDKASDPVWADKASARLREMVKDLPYLVQKPNVQCGSTECEITIVTVSGLSNANKDLIVNTLAQPAYGDDKQRYLTVRQIWSNKDLGEPGSGFHAFYMRR